MFSQRWRPLFISGGVLLAIWVITISAYTAAKHAKVTAEKVKAYVESVDFGKLKGDARAKALERLEEMLNALSIEERRQARLDHDVWAWFNQMTEDEKASFLEATMPTGFKQMLSAFEQLPEDKRKKTIDDAMRRLKDSETKAQASTGQKAGDGTNLPPVLSPELESKVRSIGLQTFYSQSSPQTKAELAPVLEEMQRVMESGRPFRR